MDDAEPLEEPGDVEVEPVPEELVEPVEVAALEVPPVAGVAPGSVACATTPKTAAAASDAPAIDAVIV